jgi:hypothetical protein
MGTNNLMSPRSMRRIVIGNNSLGEIEVFSDGETKDIKYDPARPGYASNRIWVTEETPAKVVDIKEIPDIPHSIIPPKNGSLCRFLTIPPDSSFIEKINEKNINNYVREMNLEHVSTYHKNALHPYMQKTDTLDYIYVMSGNVSLILDEDTVDLATGDTVVILGGNHAWSNKSKNMCELFISSHDGSKQLF